MWVSHEVLWDGGDGGVVEPMGLGTTWWADMMVGLCVEQECLAWVCRVIAVIIPILSDQVVSSCREKLRRGKSHHTIHVEAPTCPFDCVGSKGGSWGAGALTALFPV